MILNHTTPLQTIQDHTGPCKAHTENRRCRTTTLDCVRTYRPKQDYNGNPPTKRIRYMFKLLVGRVFFLRTFLKKLLDYKF